MNRRRYLTLTGATLGATAGFGTASAYHVQDPYADEYEPADPSNYTDASRGAAAIDWIVIHLMDCSYSCGVDTFQDPAADVSAHYALRNSDGYASQMVHHEDVAWHAGGTNYNAHSIGLEHGGEVDSTRITDAMYGKSANIVAWLCDQYGIPKEHPTGVAPCDATSGEGGIIGHHQVPESDCGYNDHTDPGSTWDWDHYMSLVRDGSGGSGSCGDGGSGGPNVIRFEAHVDADYSFHTTGDINRYASAECSDENIYISGNDHDEIQGTMSAGGVDEFNYADTLAWIDTPSLYIDVDDDVIRFHGKDGSGSNDYSFRATGDVDKLGTAESGDTIDERGGEADDEVDGTVSAGYWDEFQFEGRIAWLDTPEFYVDIDW